MTSTPGLLKKDEVRYFYEDEVYRIKRNGNVQFGMVIANSEFVSSDEDDEEECEPLAPGKIRVAWHPNGEEEVVKEKHVGLADRSLMPGDVVRRLIYGKDTQRGYCREVQVRASVEIVGSQQVIFDVDSKDLVPLEEFTVDVAVCLDSWVGMIKAISTMLTLKLPDGSICEMTDDTASALEDIMDKRDEDCEFRRYEFYPGQVLSGPMKVFAEATFTHSTDEMKNFRNSGGKAGKAIKAVVEQVKVTSVNVIWQCRSYTNNSTLSDLNSAMPPQVIKEAADLDRLKMLNVFEPCTLQIGDRNYYTLKPEDIIMMKDEWRKLEKESFLKVVSSKRNVKKAATLAANSLDSVKKRPEGEEESSADEESDESGLKAKNPTTAASASSKASVPASTLSKKKKLKRSRKISDRSVAASFIDLKPGDKVIVETLCTKSEATVVWQDGSIESSISSRELYPIHALDDQEFFPGDFVVRSVIDGSTSDLHAYGVIQSVDHAGRTCSVKWFRTYTSGNEPQPLFVGTSLEPVYDLKDHPDFKYRPGSIVIRVANMGDVAETTGGQVLDNYTSGQVLVWWANNTTEACWPQDLFKIGEYDSDDGELWDDNGDDEDDENPSDDSWETESESDHGASEDLDDAKSRAKLAANVERTRIAMTKLEDIFNDKSSTVTTSLVVKQLLDVYKNCRYLDKLMNTDYFNEVHFGDLLEKVRERSKSNSSHQAVQDQMQRLFSEGQSPVKPDGSGDQEEPELNQICAKLCGLIKIQLVKGHDEVMERCGGQAANFTADDLTQSPGEEEIDLEGLATKIWTHPTSPKNDGGEEASAGLCKAFKVVSNYDISNALYGTKDDSIEPISGDIGEFAMMEVAPSSHKFKLSVFQPNDPKNFIKFVRKEVKLLRTSLPSGIIVKGFEDRMDLYSVMIRGPEKTPYEDGLFFFDFQLSADYPKAPPICHYHSYVTDRLNPNLYEDGKVCVSLLGTWSGKGTETWTPNSNLLQLLVSIQGLILVAEPYFNEAGYEKQKGTQQGLENSRMYNEMVILKLVQAMTRLAIQPPEAFTDEVKDHLKNHAEKLITRIESWWLMSCSAMNCSSSTTPEDDMASNKGPDSFKSIGELLPEFPLVPASKGFCLSLSKSLEAFKSALKASNMRKDSACGASRLCD